MASIIISVNQKKKRFRVTNFYKRKINHFAIQKRIQEFPDLINTESESLIKKTQQIYKMYTLYVCGTNNNSVTIL